MNIKKIFTISLFVIIFIIFQFYSASFDYSWDSKYIASVQDRWEVYTKYSNCADPIFFYSFFKPPVCRIGIIDRTTLKKISENVYFVNLKWIDKNPGPGGAVEEPFSYILNCNNHRAAMVENENRNPPESVDIDSLEWTSDEFLKKYPDALEKNKSQCEFIKKLIE